jgi:hypothetical protein
MNDCKIGEKDMIFKLGDLNEDCAKQICTWKYDGDCSI